MFKRPPKLLAADRSCWSAGNEATAEAEGVEQVCLPKPGAKSEESRSACPNQAPSQRRAGLLAQTRRQVRGEQVCLPKPGAKSEERIAHEGQGWFVRGCNWRAGIEGRIHGLKKGQKLDRCLYHGEAGMQRWVGWGVISHDLWRIAQATAQTA